MTYGVVPPAEQRVMLNEFDAVEQARIWLDYGPEAATQIFVGYLRMARLFGDTVVFNRSQVLDGIVMLSLGPAGVRRALGVGCDEPMPVTILCSRESPPSAPLERIISAEISAVDALPNSSAAYALHPTSVPPETQWMYFDNEEHRRYAETAGVEQRVYSSYRFDLEARRGMWREAIQQGKFQLEYWSPLSFDMSALLNLSFNPDIPGLVAEERALVESVLANFGPEGFNALFDRSAALEFVAGLPADAHARRAVMDWWDAAYREGLAASNRCKPIRLTPFTEAAYGDRAVLARALGLLSEYQPWRQRLRQWVAWRLGFGDQWRQGRIWFSGDVVDILREMDAETFSKLIHLTEAARDRFWAEPTRAAVYDLTLAAREHWQPLVTRHHRSRALLLIVAIAALLIGVAVLAQALAGSYGGTGWWILLATLAGFLIGGPLARKVRGLWLLRPWSVYGTVIFKANENGR